MLNGFRRLPRFLLLAIVAVAGFSFATSAFAARQFWVSPDGDDLAPGTPDQPFRTLERARDAVRALPRPLAGPVAVNLADGVYRLEQPLILDARDSGEASAPIVYRAVTGETPEIRGSIPIQGWELVPGTLDLYVAPTPQVRSRQFFVNGERAQRARTSDDPASFVPFFIPDDLPIPQNREDPCNPPTTQVPVTGSGGIESVVDPLNPSGWRDPSTWTNQSEIEAVILAQWKSMRVRVDRVTDDPGLLDPESRLIMMQTPGWWNANMFRSAPVSIPGISDDVFPTADGEPALWSFWKVSYFENALEFLDEPGEWYLDEAKQLLYYIPRPGEDLTTAEAELPVLEALIDVRGAADAPVRYLRFENLTFAYATWLGPSSADGYVSDQSGFHVVGEDHLTNFSGHVENVQRTPGNLRFLYAQDIGFSGNTVWHMGGVGLDAGAGSQRLRIDNNRFEDISSAAIQLGGVQKADARPDTDARTVRNNRITDNQILYTGQDYFDAAGIFVGFSTETLIAHNSISHVPWSGIALGWGWGLLDPGSYPGVSNACSGDWGQYDTPTINSRNRIIFNRIENFLEKLWDGGAIYTLGQQGTSLDNGLRLVGNVASNKRPEAGSNIFYTDGGSRYVQLLFNAEFDNSTGSVDFGSGGALTQLLPNATQEILGLISLADFPYGGSIGGCRTYGDNLYRQNFLASLSFFDICPFTEAGITYPTNLQFEDNAIIEFREQVPQRILDKAGPR